MNKKILLSFVFLTIFFAFSEMSNGTYAQKLNYNFEDTTSIPIKLSIVDEITTKGGLLEGKYVDFKVLETVRYNNKIVAKENDIVKGRIETFVTRGMNGFPAEIIVDNFQFDNIKKTQLVSTYKKAGANRCFWVYPIKWALTPIPFVGSLTNFIIGGEAKIRTKDVITIYYYPNWK